MAKKQLVIDARLSHAKELTYLDIKLILNLLQRYFSQQAKTLGTKTPKGTDPKNLIAKLQEDLASGKLSPAKINSYIKRLHKLKEVNSSVGDLKGLAENAKKIAGHLDEACKLFSSQENGYKAVNKITAQPTGRKKRSKASKAEAEAAVISSRLDHIILIIGHMEAEGKSYIVASVISERLQASGLDQGSDSTACVRSCLRAHRYNRPQEIPLLVDTADQARQHKYFLTDEGKKRFQALIDKTV